MIQRVDDGRHTDGGEQAAEPARRLDFFQEHNAPSTIAWDGPAVSEDEPPGIRPLLGGH